MKNVGIPLKPPERTCNDRLCPFHGSLPVRGILQRGKVVSVASGDIVVVEKQLTRYSSKFSRYYRVRKHVHAKLPKCIPVQVGDYVTLGECRPLSKSVSFVVLENRGSG
jgi:small subunit ribosomal protein S17